MPSERRPLKLLFINDDEGMRDSFRLRMEYMHPKAHIFSCATVPEAEKVLKEHPDVNAVISDAVLEPFSYGAHRSIPHFLAEVEKTHPKAHVALYTGIVRDFDSMGLPTYLIADEKKFLDFVKSLKDHPYRVQETEPLRVLYVDEKSVTSRAFVKELRNRLGRTTQITHVSNTCDAINHLENHKTDVVISDIKVNHLELSDEGLERFSHFMESTNGRMFSSGVDFLAHAQEKYGVYPIATSYAYVQKEAANLPFIPRSNPQFDAGLAKQYIDDYQEALAKGEERKRIDLDAIVRIGPVLHVTPDGKKELIELVKRSQPDDPKVEMIRLGKRYPLNNRQRIDALNKMLKDETLSGKEKGRLMKWIDKLRQSS